MSAAGRRAGTTVEQARADLAARHGGTVTHCQHSATTICRRCVVPLHCVVDALSAYRFPDAASAVAFMREFGKAAADATRAAWLTR